MRYRYNPHCACPRCRAHGYMGPAVLITLGVLFLLSETGHTYWLNFDRTWPALLIVIGLVSFLKHGASTQGHVSREFVAVQPAPGAYVHAPVAPVAQVPVVTPAPVQPGGSLPPAGSPDNTGVNHG